MFLSSTPQFPKNFSFGSFPLFAVYPYGKRNVQKKISVEDWWNDTEKRIAKCYRLRLTRIMEIQSVPRSKHSVSVIKTSQLMLYREIIAVCSQIHTKHINTVWTECSRGHLQDIQHHEKWKYDALKSVLNCMRCQFSNLRKKSCLLLFS